MLKLCERDEDAKHKPAVCGRCVDRCAVAG